MTATVKSNRKITVTKKVTPIKAKKPSTGSSSKSSSKNGQDPIFQSMCELHSIGIKEAPVEILAMFTGYMNARSTGFAAPLKELVKRGLIVKVKNRYSISEFGIMTKLVTAHTLKPPKDNGEFQQRLFPILEKKLAATDKLRTLWDELCDGKSHDKKKLANVVGYKNPRSSGYTKMIAVMTSLELVTETSKSHVVLADICFPFGRP